MNSFSSKLIFIWILYFTSLNSIISSELTSIWDCNRIGIVVDSIFNNELEESDFTRSIIPILYQNASSFECNAMPKILTAAGIIYYNEGKYFQARTVLERADSIFQIQTCKNKICVFTKLFRGLTELKEGNFESAILLFRSAGQKSKELNFYSGELQALIDEALVYMQTEELEKARSYLIEASTLIDKSESIPITGYVFLNLGRTYALENNSKKAKENFEKAKRIWSEISFTKGLYFLESNYANVAKNQGDITEYEYHLKKALEIMEQDSSLSRSNAYIELGYHYLEQNNEEEAIHFLQKGLEISDGHEEEEFLALISSLINLYSKRNDANKISEVSQKLREIYRTKLARVSSQETKWQKKEFILESKIIENENLIKLQEEAAYKVRIRNLLLGLFVILFTLLGFAVVTWSRSQKIKEQLRLEQLRTKISKDLHDDVGTVLAGISFQSQILESTIDIEHKKVIRTISSKSNEAIVKMRDMVWALNDNKSAPIDLEYKMKDYIASVLEDSSFKFSFENNVPNSIKKLTPEHRHCIYIIFKESIYNILKHSDGNEIKILLDYKLNNIRMAIQDNGSEKEIKSSGQGLQNMNERAEQIGGDYKFFYDNGYRTILNVPI